MRITLSVKVEETKRLERLVVKNSLCAQFEKKETNREIVDVRDILPTQSRIRLGPILMG